MLESNAHHAVASGWRDRGVSQVRFFPVVGVPTVESEMAKVAAVDTALNSPATVSCGDCFGSVRVIVCELVAVCVQVRETGSHGEPSVAPLVHGVVNAQMVVAASCHLPLPVQWWRDAGKRCVTDVFSTSLVAASPVSTL